MRVLALILITLLIMSKSSAAQKGRKAEEAKGLEVGQVAPLFEATDQNGETFSLEETLKKGPVVIIFYRGQWCPICNRHLTEVQNNLKYILDKGATVVAISPENHELAERTTEKTGAEFPILYDKDYKIANAYDVTFTPKKTEVVMYNTALNANLRKANSGGSVDLPIPATYVVGKEGKIIWRHFNPNYKERSAVHDIINSLSEK